MKSLMLRLDDGTVKIVRYLAMLDAMNFIEALPGLTRAEKAYYYSLLFHGTERVIKRGKIIFELTNVLDDIEE